MDTEEVWVGRDFDEFDEHIPDVAKVIVRRGIEFWRLEEESCDPTKEAEVASSMLAILKEMVACTNKMTEDELEHSLETLVVGCRLVCMVEEGLCEEENGKYSLTEEALKQIDDNS